MTKKAHRTYMKQLLETLKEIGLTETESALYVAGRTLGQVGISDFMKETGIRRTTIYSALDSLIERGLCAKTQKQSRTLYTMSDPTLLEKELEYKEIVAREQKEAFADVLPLFERLDTSTTSGMSVVHHEGIAGVKTVINEALYCREKKWRILAPAKNFLSEFDREYADYFMETRKRRGIYAESLWEGEFVKKRRFSELSLKERGPRLLPRELEGSFKTTILLFDTKVAFIASLKEKGAILIDSKEVHASMCVLFDGLYKGARPLSSRYRKEQ